jgi:hypothetical protein
MKLIRITLATALFLAGSISFSQTDGGIAVDIPFAFVVAERTLPPGHYMVTRLLNGNLAIHDRENRGVFVTTYSAQRLAPENTTKMVFDRYGDTYFLSEVWIGGDSLGRSLPLSRAERQLAKSGTERELAVLRLGK